MTTTQKRGRRQPVRIRAVALVAFGLAGLIATVIVGMASMLRFRDSAMDQSKAYAHMLAESLAIAAIDPLVIEAYVSLEGAVGMYASRTDVTRVLVCDYAGRVVASSDPGLLGSFPPGLADGVTEPSGHLSDSGWEHTVGRDSYEAGARVRYAGANLGAVYVTVSLSSIRSSMATILLFIVVTGLGAWAISLFFAHGMSRLIAVPVEKVTDLAGRIAGGDFNVEPQPSGIRELDQLGKALAWMAKAIRTREGELSAAREAADRQNKAKSVFLQAASHELRTPLNGIQGILSVSHDQCEHPDRAALLAQRVSQLSMIVDGLMDVASFDAGPPSLIHEAFPCSELVADLRTAARMAMETSRLELVEDIGTLPARLVGDERRLVQVCRQFLSNAAKFATAGPVRLGLSYGDGILKLSVSDGGPGIAPERRAELFKPFDILDDPRTRKSGGAGLGLAIAAGIVRAAGGSVAVEDSPDGGALFTAQFPVQALEKEAESAPTRPGQDATPGEPGEKSVLLVEDEAINRLYAKNLLKRSGYRVAVAADGQEAVDMAMRSRFDIILMDIGLPAMSGIEAARRIRSASGLNTASPIIAVSAHDLPDDRRLCQEAGMDGFVPKPINERELLEKMASAC